MRTNLVAKRFNRENRFMARLRGTKYSVCDSAPLLGVKFMRKCGSRYSGPGIPRCSSAIFRGVSGQRVKILRGELRSIKFGREFE